MPWLFVALLLVVAGCGNTANGGVAPVFTAGGACTPQGHATCGLALATTPTAANPLLPAVLVCDGGTWAPQEACKPGMVCRIVAGSPVCVASSVGGDAGQAPDTGTLCPDRGETACGGACVDTKTDANNCGKCGVTCASGATCQAGGCLCPGGETDCGGSCVDRQTDANNCGACGKACGTATKCQVGVCLCGNGKPDPGEQCDGSDLGAATCQTQAHDSGTLKCGPSCTFDVSGCGVCTDGSKNGTETDADCGGGECSPCAVGKTCAVAADCSSGVCGGGVCKYVAPGTWVPLKAATFQMGSPTTEPCRSSISDVETQHQVTLSNKFLIPVTEVTQKQFSEAMGYNPSQFAACGGDCPVEKVSWHEAAAYCNALSTKAQLTTCYSCTGDKTGVSCKVTAATGGKGIYACPGYRLPTEAEWEYAYRAGTTTAYYNGKNTNCSPGADANAQKIAWYGFTSSGSTHPVGKKTANAWGLRDMAGNVFEWCHDGWSKPGAAAVTDPVTSPHNYQVFRGGSYMHAPMHMRAAFRSYGFPPTSRHGYIGFRCARTQ